MDNLKLFLFVATLVALLPLALSSFDFLKLALQWPPTLNYFNKAYYPTPVNFTVHGVWPENFTGPPLPCNTPQASPITITDVNFLTRLEYQCWPDIKNGRHQRFWDYEWRKHGGCSEGVYNYTQYLTLGCDLKDKFNLTLILESASPRIVPSFTIYYNSNDISNAIRSGTGREPELACDPAYFDPQGIIVQALREIRICFDKNLIVMDCPPPLTLGRASGLCANFNTVIAI